MKLDLQFGRRAADDDEQSFLSRRWMPVQEFTVNQNSVDAEFAMALEAALSLSMRSGTNAFTHRLLFSAAIRSGTPSPTRSAARRNFVRNHIWGGTVGPSYLEEQAVLLSGVEEWRIKDPRSTCVL